jgi:hypothetical protein
MVRRVLSKPPYEAARLKAWARRVGHQGKKAICVAVVGIMMGTPARNEQNSVWSATLREAIKALFVGSALVFALTGHGMNPLFLKRSNLVYRGCAVDTAAMAATDVVCVGVFPMILPGNCASTIASRANPAISIAANRLCVRAIETLRIGTIFSGGDCQSDDEAKPFEQSFGSRKTFCSYIDVPYTLQGWNPFRESCLSPADSCPDKSFVRISRAPKDLCSFLTLHSAEYCKTAWESGACWGIFETDSQQLPKLVGGLLLDRSSFRNTPALQFGGCFCRHSSP